MGDKLVHELNEFFARPEIRQFNKYARVIGCAEQPFEYRKVDLPEVPPQTDVPEYARDTPMGQMAIKGAPAMKGTVYKYYVKCEPPADDPTTFDRVHEVFASMPPQFNNVAWTLVGNKQMMGLHLFTKEKSRFCILIWTKH